MKKIFTICIGLTLHNISYAQDLLCESSYPEFNQYITDSHKISKYGDIKQLNKFYEDHAYSRLFKSKHPNHTYHGGDWMENKEYQLTLQFQQATTKSDKYQHIKFNLQPPKANFISTVGEVCVVPWTSEDKFFDKTYISQTDLIFVRNLNSNQWRNFVYLGIEKPEDFKEFFPDFPKSIKLSAATANGQYATTNQVYEISTNMLKFLFKSELSPAVVEEINNTIKDAEERLKVNGFNE